MKSVLVKLIVLYNILIRINFKFLFLKWDKDSKNVLWIPNNGFFNLLRYLLGSSELVSDASILNYLINNKKSYKIIFGNSKIGLLKNNNIYYRAIQINWFGFYNYVSSSQNVLKNLEAQGNVLYPPLKEYKFWENKAYMHKVFTEKGINQPLTKILNVNINNKNIVKDTFSYPFLIKELHSAASQGLYKVNNYEEFLKISSNIKNKGGVEFIAQELLEMRKDLRVIIIKDEIVLYYWRINNAKEWRPTSTSFGSNVDFVTFPEKWKIYIIDSLKKLDLKTGAFDITWRNDDVNTKPVFLEVSPFYQPNPEPPQKYSNIPYSKYKKIIFGKDNYVFKAVDIKFKLYNKLNNNE